MELKERKQMNTKDLWDLSKIFPDRKAWEAAFAEAKTAIEKISAVKGTLHENTQSLKNGLDTVYEAMQKTELVYLYASLQKSGDNGDPEYQEMEARAINLYVSLETACSFLEPEILLIPQEKLDAQISEPSLSVYRHILEDILRGKDHTLSEEQEKMLAALSEASGACQDAFGMLESVDMTFPKMKDEAGEEITLTHGNFGVYRESADSRVRREAFSLYFGEFKKYINTFAALYSGSVKMDNYYALMRRHKSACHKALFASNVPMEVYSSLIEAVHQNLPSMEDYLELRKNALSLSELSMYDLYCPMVEDIPFHFTYEEAAELVKKALLPLGENYQHLLEKAFSERWIDIYENKGKTTGAFSCGVYGVHPYVLLNFTETLDDVFTIAHELGHAMHSYLSAQNQPYPTNDYKILVAEVASTVNEVLLTRYLLSVETDPKRKAYILNHFLESFRTTVFRQTLFAEFEKKAHDMAQNGEPLTAKTLSDLYGELNRLYYKGAVPDELSDMEWARIPHFYNAFYVYQYATGFCSAVAIADSILKTKNPKNYLNFLSTGGSDYPIEELKIAGVDLTDPGTVTRALAVFADTIKELAELL